MMNPSPSKGAAGETKSPAASATSSSRTSRKGDKDLAFIGVRIPKDVHQRLYRAKASLEFETGKFYGMGRLIERVIRRGLTQIERELGNSGPVENIETED